LAFSLVFGVFSVPTGVSAFSWSTLLGEEASASISGTTTTEIGNSQTGLALEPSVSPSSINPKKDGGIDNSVEVNIFSDNALFPTASPKEETFPGTGGGDFEGDLEIYVVRSGDTVATVAELFGVSTDTVLSANDLPKGSKLKTGQILLILPYSGVEHTVAKGETLQGIAGKYKVDIDDILSANDIEDGSSIVVGAKLMIPGGNILNSSGSSRGSGSGGYKGGGSSNIPSVIGYFANPVPGSVKSRGVKVGHKGVDFAAPTGTPIHASAEGVVLIARTGYNGGFGTYVVIQHPNGVKTLYAHMSKLGTTPGSRVSQGDVIGYVGNTGRSTGPHTHFETIGAKNPF
jgi:murein DD-endopeptidase MepM/ murein hydrolase activator NlpD